MQILVISDTHGRSSRIENVIEKHPQIKHIFFLGDGIRDIEDCAYIYSDRTFHIVEGNCDGYTMYKSSDYIEFCGKKILFTHGHMYDVKYTDEKLKKEAKSLSVNLVLYGHTHTAKIEYADGIYFVNPGSLYSGRDGCCSYAIIDLVDSGIMPNIIKF